MFRASAVLLMFSFTAQPQNRPTQPPDTQQSAQASRKSFFRSRRGLAAIGAALAGAGVALLATSGRTRQVPASNCSFYPAPFIPCVPAHEEKTRSGVQNGLGGGLLVGGFGVVYVSMR